MPIPPQRLTFAVRASPMVPDDGKIGDIPTMTEQESAGGRHWLRVPHTLVLMVIMMAAALVLTWILPAGSFQMQPMRPGA